MATRPVFEVINNKPFVIRRDTEFAFCNGFSLCQKQKSIRNLHNSYSADHPGARIMEVSSKSENPLGVSLSAFNLSFCTSMNRRMTVETAFQGSKIFEKGGPYTDLYFGTSLAAKKDPRIRESGKVIAFSLFGKKFDINPMTYFYDWLYINALILNPDLCDRVMDFDAFTDIEFNPERSVNCQAEAVAMYVGLRRTGMLETFMKDKESFLKIF